MRIPLHSKPQAPRGQLAEITVRKILSTDFEDKKIQLPGEFLKRRKNQIFPWPAPLQGPGVLRFPGQYVSDYQQLCVSMVSFSVEAANLPRRIQKR
jgi:hypothetical protein